jgi:hypothetical protein
MEEEVGRVLDPPSRWVRVEWDEPDLIGIPVEGLDGSCMTFLYELSDDGQVLRSIELMGESRVPVGASSQAEFWEAQGYKRQAATPALVEYEKQYGGVPEGSEQDWGDYPHVEIAREEFERVWRTSRQYLAQRPRDSHFRKPEPSL